MRMDPVSAVSKVLGIDKLVDYGASGVGAIAGPFLAPWKASREGNARLTAAKVDAQIREIEARGDASALKIIAEAQAEAQAYLLPADADLHARLDITPQDITQSFEFQGRKRLANARTVLEAAADELGDKEVDDHEPDLDWTARFFDHVQDVSSEDMQKIWAKILAGEVESPGRTSLRTLDTLRNMTRRDAEMFRDICQFVIENEFIFYSNSAKDLSGLTTGILLHLQGCGLVDYQANRERTQPWKNSGYIVLYYSNGALKITGNGTSDTPLGIPALRLTAAGRDLAKLSPQPMSMEYLRTFAEFLKSKNCRLEYAETIVLLDDGAIWVPDSVPIEPEPD